jgi:WD40 repeat protein
MVMPSTDYVLISYSRKDERVMRRIVMFLRNRGVKIWMDNERLVPGTPIWEEEIEKAIKGAGAIVVLLSPDSKISEWVRREISYADQYRKRIFPVLVRGDEDSSITLRLITRQYVDLRQNENAGLNSLSEALQQYLDKLNSLDESDRKDSEPEITTPSERHKNKNRFAQIADFFQWKKIRQRFKLKNPIVIIVLFFLFLGYCGFTCLNSFLRFSNTLYGVAFSPDGQTLATGKQGEIMLWRVSDGNLIKTLNPDPISGKIINNIVFSFDGQTIAFSSSSGDTVNLIQVNDGSLLQTLEGHVFSIESMAFSPNGKILASGSMDKSIMLWNIDDGSLLQVLKGHEDTVISLAFSPDTQILASGSQAQDSVINLWDTNDGSLLQTLNLKGNWINYVNSVAFSADGKTLASGSSDDIVRLWDVSNGSLLHTLTEHTDNINSVAFSPDGQILASGSDDGTIRLWQVNDGNLLHTLKGRNGNVRSLAFSADGFTVIAYTDDNTILLWRVTNGTLLKRLKIGN